MQYRPHFIGGQVDVGLPVVALHEAVPIAVAKNSALELNQQS
jgi:hypothetical protein